MNTFLKLFLSTLFLFTAIVDFPLGGKHVYENVVDVSPHGNFFILTLTSDKKVYVPTMWTVIEEN